MTNCSHVLAKETLRTRMVREHTPRKYFLCDCNLVSFGDVLLRFCLKNDKNNDKL